jgi:lipoyl synthase
MLGFGETDDEVIAVMRDLREHRVDMLAIGQYLQPGPGNLPVRRYVTPTAFDALAEQARRMGFKHAVCGPLVRSSYHADRQAQAAGLSLSSTTNH